VGDHAIAKRNDDEEGKNSPETAIGVSKKKRKQKRKRS
jgi:hypothetical protein